MATTWNLSKGLAAVVTASVAALGLCPSAAADPAAPQPTPQSSAAQQLPGLPALSQLSPLIQQAAGDPQQATQLLMAAAQAFAHSPTAPSESKNVAAAVNQFVQEPTAPVQHVPATGVEPGVQAHLPAGINPVHAAGPAPQPAPEAHLPAGVDPAHAAGAGPAKIPLPGPGPGQTAYVFTAVGTPGPAEVQKLPLNVTWVNLTTGKSGTVALKPRPDINPDGPTTLSAIADTGSGSIMSTIFGQVTTKEKQCQFMPTIGSTVVP